MKGGSWPVGIVRFSYRVCIYRLRSESARAAYFTNAAERRARVMREAGTWSSATINYVRRFLRSVVRAFLLERKKLPDRPGVNLRGVFYERNAETDPIDAINWNLIAPNTNYAMRFLAIWKRGFLSPRKNSAPQFGISARGVFRERNGEKGQIYERSWNFGVWGYQLRRKVSWMCYSRVPVTA